MGGGPSRVSPYILRCVDADVEAARAGTPPKVKKGTSQKSGFPPFEREPSAGATEVPTIASVGPLSPSMSSRKLLTRSISQLASADVAVGGVPVSRTRAVYSSRHNWLLRDFSGGVTKMDQLEVGRVIGTGLMGTVRLAKIKDKGGYIALKAIRKDYIVKHKNQPYVENERRVLLCLQSPFCIRLFGAFQDGPNVYLAMQLAVGGELFSRLSKGDKNGLPAEECKFYVSEIFSALEHVQQLGFVYRDLKPENVMLDEEGHCKLVDFGFATTPDGNGICRTLCGTPAYLSPEQLNGKFTGGYNKCCDWWALGIILYELMTGKTPFCNNPRETSYEIYLRILKNRLKFPRSWKDAKARDLVMALCHPSLDKRLIEPDLIKNNTYFVIPWESVVGLKMVPPFVPKIKDEKDRDHYFSRRYLRYPPEDHTDNEGRLDLEGF